MMPKKYTMWDFGRVTYVTPPGLSGVRKVTVTPPGASGVIRKRSASTWKFDTKRR